MKINSKPRFHLLTNLPDGSVFSVSLRGHSRVLIIENVVTDYGLDLITKNAPAPFAQIELCGKYVVRARAGRIFANSQLINTFGKADLQVISRSCGNASWSQLLI